MGALFAVYEPDAHGVRTDVVVQPLGTRHLDACVALAVQREGGDPAAWRAALESGMDATDRATLVALVDGELAGYSTVAWLAPGVGHPTTAAPDGWYLLGLVVDPSFRRRGVGHRLTAERLRWLQGRADRVWYFASSANRASIDLHSAFGFRLQAEDLEFPGVGFTDKGHLYGADVATPFFLETVLDVDRSPAATDSTAEPAGPVSVGPVQGRVKFWKTDKGWGAISSDELPTGRDVFAHFSVVEAEGYRELRKGQQVSFGFHAAEQDSFLFVADWVRAVD